MGIVRKDRPGHSTSTSLSVHQALRASSRAEGCFRRCNQLLRVTTGRGDSRFFPNSHRGGGGGYSCTPWDVLLGVFQLFWPVQPQTLRKFGKRKYTPSDPRSMNRSPGLFTNPVVVGKPSTSWLGLRWFWPNEGEPATYHERP